MSSGRRTSTTLRIGSRVEYTIVGGVAERKKVSGTIAYGPGSFHLKPQENDWCGVILDEPFGKNNGTIQGKQYFECQDNFGVMVRVATLRPILDKNRTTRRATPSTTPKSMTPSSSISSFTDMLDSGSSMQSSDSKPTTTTTAAMTTSQTERTSKLRPPTKIMTSSLDNQSQQPQQQQQSNIRQMVEKIEIKRDEKLREDDATQDISQIIDTSTTTSSTTTTQSNTPTHKSTKEVQELMEKCKDLESKLQTIMLKRAEDRLKFKEFERVKIQNEQLLENKKQMAEKIAELSKQKSLAEKEAQDAREEQIRQAEEIKDLVDNAEMAVIDKEMAENKSEQLQLELEQCREQLEEAKLDFEILKTEIEDKGVDGAANSFQLKKLEEQNLRLKEALLKLRDISATDRNNLQMMQKDFERKNEELNSLMQLNEKNSKQLKIYLEQIEDLKEQVDMALGSQEMVEKLTEKNLTMEDKLEELQKALDEEENIKELSNMIIEEKDEIIADLRDELEQFKTQLFNLRNNYLISKETIQDHELTIKKFRELVQLLKEENLSLRKLQEQDLTKVQEAVDVEKQLANIQFKNRLLDRKDLSRAIDLELKQLDLNQCFKQMFYLSKFFPEKFFQNGGNYDCIAVLLFIPRLFQKCFIIERQILEKFSQNNTSVIGDNTTVGQKSSESIVLEVFSSSTNNDSNQQQSTIQLESLEKLKQQIFLKHLIYLLTSIRTTLNKYQIILKNCNLQLFEKLGSLFSEFQSHEKNLDYFLELLREDKLDETISLDSLEKILNYLQSLYNIYMVNGSNNTANTTGDTSNTKAIETSSSNALDQIHNQNHNKFLNDLLDVLRTGSEATLLDLKILSKLFQDNDSLMFLTTMETILNDLEQFCKKIRRKIINSTNDSNNNSNTNGSTIKFPLIIEAELLDSFHNFTLIIRSLKTIRQVLMQQYLDQFSGATTDQIDQNQLHQNNSNVIQKFTMNDLERICKEWTGNSLKTLQEMLQNILNSIGKFSTLLQQGDFDTIGINSNETGNSVGELSSSFTTNNNLLPQSFQNLFSSSGSRSQQFQQQSLQQLKCLPLDQLAQQWRKKTEQLQDFQKKISTQDQDILELKRALKLKIDEISEIQIRRDLSEKKLKETQENLKNLQLELERKQKEFEENEAEKERIQIKYNQEINDLYSDHRIMKEKLKDFSKNALLGKMLITGGGPSATSSPLASSSSSASTAQASPGNLSIQSTSIPFQSLSPNSSLLLSSSSNSGITIHGGGGGGTSGTSPYQQQQQQQQSMIMMQATSNDVVELQQQIQNLRLAMKNLAKNNLNLKTLLLSNEEIYKFQNDNSVELIKLRPKWYLESLKNIQQKNFQLNPLIIQQKFQEFRLKLLNLKQQLIQNNFISSKKLLLDLDQFDNQSTSSVKKSDGWSRSINDLIKKQQQQKNLEKLQLELQFKQLIKEFEQFLKQLDSNFYCNSTFVSFLQPKISKVLNCQPKLLARVKVGGCGSSDNNEIIPIEITKNELKQIQTMLLSY